MPASNPCPGNRGAPPGSLRSHLAGGALCVWGGHRQPRLAPVRGQHSNPATGRGIRLGEGLPPCGHGRGRARPRDPGAAGPARPAHRPRPATQCTATQLPGSSQNLAFSRLSQSSTTLPGGGAPSSNGQSCGGQKAVRLGGRAALTTSKGPHEGAGGQAPGGRELLILSCSLRPPLLQEALPEHHALFFPERLSLSPPCPPTVTPTSLRVSGSAAPRGLGRTPGWRGRLPHHAARPVTDQEGAKKGRWADTRFSYGGDLSRRSGIHSVLKTQRPRRCAGGGEASRGVSVARPLRGPTLRGAAGAAPEPEPVGAKGEAKGPTEADGEAGPRAKATN